MGRPKKVEMATAYGTTAEQTEQNDERVKVTLDTLEEITEVTKVGVGPSYPVLKVKLVHPYARLPQRANPTDAGADLFATEELAIGAKDSKFMDFGIQMEIPEGMVGFVFARSGLGSKGIRPRNCVGVIDSKYRGNLGIMIENNSENTYRVSTGDRIAQLVLMPVYCLEIVESNELDMSEDRNGGFGSTGK